MTSRRKFAAAALATTAAAVFSMAPIGMAQAGSDANVQRLDLRWNTAGMWASLTAERPMPVNATEGAAVPWLVWRAQLTTRFRSLEPDECAAFDCLRDGGSFGDACERLTAFIAAESVPLRAATLLKTWTGHGLIGAVRTGDRDATHEITPSACAIYPHDRPDTGRNISPP